MNFSSFLASISLMLWGVAFLYFRSYIKRRTAPEKILGEFQEEVSKMVSEIDAATDRDITLVEDRVKALRALLEETDRRLSSLKREVERRSDEERAYADLGRRASRTQASQRSPDPGLFPEIQQSDPSLSVSPHNAQSAQREVSQQTPLQGPLPVEPLLPPVRTPARPRFIRSATPVEPKPAPFSERVAELHRSGFSAELISSTLKASLSEVELAIALYTRMDEDHGGDTGY